MKREKSCHKISLSWVKVFSFTLLLAVLFFPSGMEVKALIPGVPDSDRQIDGIAAPRNLGTETSLRQVGPSHTDPVNALDPFVENPYSRAVRMLAGMTPNAGDGGSLLNGAGTGKLYLPLIFNNFNPALFSVVPYVLNLTQADAETAILAAQLTLGTVAQGTSPTVPAGRVKSQNPAAGLYVAKGAAVDLVISLGPAMVSVPDVFNRPQADAGGLITAAGLLVGTVSQQNSDAVALGNVISQSPPAGTVVAEGTAVDLVISLGKLVAMVQVPDTVGQLQADAEAAVLASGLTVGTVTQGHSPIVPAGRVISQNPAAGSLVPPGSAVNLVVSLGGSVLPPDPVTVAPPVDPTVATTVARSTEFLYTGPNPIQTGVAPGTIDARRAAVLRGKVLDRDGNPLPGRDHHHSQSSRIRPDPEPPGRDVRYGGQWGRIPDDQVPEGRLPRSPAAVECTLAGLCVGTGCRPDTSLIPEVTTIDLTSAVPIQVAQGSVVTDSDGTRQATLLVPQGTTAQMVMPDGSTQPLTTLSIRATEYTVGPNGPKAMPAELPPTSGYTYCVEVTADEALAAGATSVRFGSAVLLLP